MVVSGLGLIALSPLILLTALLVRVVLGRPVIFRQKRPGLHAVPFDLLKFRSMKNATDRDGNQLPDEERMTGFGRFMRKWSLDELPGLVNVLRGDMSLVGPRPLLMEYLPLYNEEQSRRHDAPPGLTGWAQINGRNELSWQEKFELDVWYVKNASMSLDFQILARTIAVVVSRQGVTGADHVTAEPFSGNPPEIEQAGE